jgi:hypothetical protein
MLADLWRAMALRNFLLPVKEPQREQYALGRRFPPGQTQGGRKMKTGLERTRAALGWIMSVWVIGVVVSGCGGGAGVVMPPGDEVEFGDSAAVETDFGRPDFEPSQAGGWLVETVDAAGNIGWQTSVFARVTPSLEVQVSYYDQIAKDLKLATSPFGAWTMATLDSEQDAGKYNSLVIDGSGGRWISYYKSAQTVRVWTTSAGIPDPARDFGAFNDVVAVGSETHISYSGVLPITTVNRRAQLRHAFWNGAAWASETIEDTEAKLGSYSFTSIARNSAEGTYHVSYRAPNGRLRHAWGTTGSWTIEEVLPGNKDTSGIGQTSVLAMPSGEVHILYSRAGSGGGLFHVWKSGGVWGVERIASGFGVMTPSAAAVTPGGIIVAVYRSDTRDLVLFRSGPWTPETIDSAGDVGQFASVFHDAAGCTHIAYVKNDTRDLKYARECAPSPPVLTAYGATPGTANEGAPIALSASAFDINGDPITFQWQQVAPATPVGYFYNANIANTTYRIPPIGTPLQAFTLEVRACDPGALCSTAQVIINGFNIFDGPGYGSSGTAGVLKCVPGGPFGPSSIEDGTPLPPIQIPLLTPDNARFEGLKSAANAMSGVSTGLTSVGEPLFSPANGGVPPLSTSFTGIGFTGLRPPDPHIAAGPNHLVAIVNSDWAIFNKAGTKLFQVSGFSWFSPVNSVSFIFDPKIIYDVYNNRWILLYHVTGSNYAKWLISASLTSDPSGCWYLYAQDNRLNGSVVSSPTNWADYTDISTDGTYTYLSGNQFGFSPQSFYYVKVRALRNSELYSGAVAGWVDYWNLFQANGDRAFTLRPAYNFGSAPPYQYLANSHWPEDDQITMWGFRDPFSPTPEVVWQGIPVNYYSFPPDARQPVLPNCYIDTIDSRIMGVSWRDGSLWAVQNEGRNWGTRYASALRLYHIDTTSWALLDDITYGEDSVDYFDGAVMEDANGNLAVVFGRSSGTINPGAYYSLKPAAGSVILPPGTLKAGASHYNPSGGGCTPTGRGERWGDYGGNWIDPTDHLTFWIFHEYAASATQWGTWVGAFQAP